MTYTEQIGPIPDWIKTLRAPGYTNIFELCDPPSLFGTEHMFGDWRGELLLLAKDFALVDEIKRRMSNGHPPHLVYHHNDGHPRYNGGLKTNQRLAGFLFGDKSIVDGRRARDGNSLYASACFFLKPGRRSEGLAKWAPGHPAFEGSKLVLEHVITHMPNLKAVVCLGNDALALVSHQQRFSAPATLTDSIGKRFGASLPVYMAPHPSRGSNEAHRAAWAFVKSDSGLSWIGG